jgi:hypothetical protein
VTSRFLVVHSLPSANRLESIVPACIACDAEWPVTVVAPAPLHPNAIAKATAAFAIARNIALS